MRIVHLRIQTLNPNADIQRAADLVIVPLQTQLASAVPEQVRKGIGEFGVVVQLATELEQEAGFLEKETPVEGQATPRGEERRDGAGAFEVRREGSLEDGELSGPREAGREGDLGEGSGCFASM
jgi:ketopantoate reductase